MAFPMRDVFGNKCFLIQFANQAIVETSDGQKRSNISGEAVICFYGDHPTRFAVSLERFSLASSSVEGKKGATGIISVIGKSAEGILKFEDGNINLNIEIKCEINYESLDRELVSGIDKGDYYIPAFEPAVAHISGNLIKDKDSLVLASFKLNVVAAAGRFGEIQLITFEMDSIPLFSFPNIQAKFRESREKDSTNTDTKSSNTDSNICISVTRRQITVQPVGFRSSAGDPNPSGSTAITQLNTAGSIWGKCCIDIQINPINLITNAILKTSSDLVAIRDSYTHVDPNIIEIFFVENPLVDTGGGNAGAIGMASCKPVIAEPNSGNPVLVSHELGHVLGLLHPGGINSNSDNGTVMAPTGSAMNPGTVYATHFMCTNINNPVIQTLLGNSCCLTHDIGNHYLRDFPVDAGAEPSEPLPAGMTRYSMSNVWNRLTNTPGTFNMSTGPEHQQPIRFNSDGTPRTNYLFAQVEQINNLKVRNAVVKFFRKNPGSGGGGANLYLIGQVPIPDALAVGSAQTVSIPWTIPPGTPQHSCIFAVVRSDAEQEGDQSSLDWWQFETLSRNDNDWAQRNLDIQDYGSGNKREDNNVESAPVIIRLPPHDGHEKLKLSLEVDAMRAAGLKRLNLAIPGKERIKIKPGELVTVNPKMSVVPDEDIFLIIQAVIAGGLPLGSSFIINVNPIVNNVKITGFSSEFHVSKPSEVIGQVIDTSMSAYVDMSDLIELPFAHDMVKKCKRLLSEPPYTLDEMAKTLVQFNKIIKRGKAELKSIPIAKELGVIEAIANWENIITRSQKRKRSPLEVIEAFRKISTRLIAVAAILAEKQVSVISS